jgi:hypothetical protein
VSIEKSYGEICPGSRIKVSSLRFSKRKSAGFGLFLAIKYCLLIQSWDLDLGCGVERCGGVVEEKMGVKRGIGDLM